MNKLEQGLQEVITELEKIAVDVSEITVKVDAEYQAKRLDKQTSKLKRIGDKIKADTNIHGGGTGEQ